MEDAKTLCLARVYGFDTPAGFEAPSGLELYAFLHVRSCYVGEKSAANVNHTTRWLQEARLTDMVARFFALYDAPDPRPHVVVGCTAFH
jgi:hypothetical protein